MPERLGLWDNLAKNRFEHRGSHDVQVLNDTAPEYLQEHVSKTTKEIYFSYQSFKNLENEIIFFLQVVLRI